MQFPLTCVWGVSLWQYQVLEGDGHHCFRAQPPVRDGPHIVLAGQRLKDGDGEYQILHFSGLHLLIMCIIHGVSR